MAVIIMFIYKLNDVFAEIFSPFLPFKFVLDEIWEGWMDGLLLYVFFNSLSVISGRWADDNERLFAMEPRLRRRRFRL